MQFVGRAICGVVESEAINRGYGVCLASRELYEGFRCMATFSIKALSLHPARKTSEIFSKPSF
jgi:hypothetical protein